MSAQVPVVEVPGVTTSYVAVVLGRLRAREARELVAAARDPRHVIPAACRAAIAGCGLQVEVRPDGTLRGMPVVIAALAATGGES